MTDEDYQTLLVAVADRRHLAETNVQSSLWQNYYRKYFEGVEALQTIKPSLAEVLDDLARISEARGLSTTAASALRVLRELLGRPNWNSDAKEPAKAYALSCFAELSYLHLSRYDVEDSDRYDFIPSESLFELLNASPRISVDLKQLFAGVDPEFRILVHERQLLTFVAMYRGDLAIIAVRGTAKASEWLTNLNAERLGTTAPQYHPGFLMEAWDGMVELKTKLAAALVRPNLYFTGHSLGGAIAAILAPRMCERTAYVFGSPRFGNAQAVERAEPYAYVRPNDLVPHLPWDRLGYANAASRLDVVGDGDPVQASAFKSLKDWLVPGGRPFAVQHDIKGYRHHLAQAANVRSPELAFLELRQAYARPLKV